MHLSEVLRRPLITEKNTILQTQGKFAFEIARKANKREVKLAVEKAFKVKVLTVNVLTVPGKTRRVGRRQVLMPSWRKAFVTLQPGDKIELFEAV